MQVRRYEFDMEPPGEAAQGSPPDVTMADAVGAAGDAENEDQRNQETIDEPGYGHGV